MEFTEIFLGNDQLYDERVHSGLAEYGDLEIITKDKVTVEGNPGVCLSFTVDVNGERKRVQCVTTVKLFMTAAAAMRGRYGGF